MSDTWKIILTGLLSSGFTIILTKVMDLIGIERASKIQLREKYFERRLEYAEKTIEYLNQKAEQFERIGMFFKKLNFISSEHENLINTSFTESYEYFFKGVDDDFHVLKIPPGMWLYFNIDIKDLPHGKLNSIELTMISQIGQFKKAIEKTKAITKEDAEKIQSLPEDEKWKKFREIIDPFVKLQANFEVWGKTLIESSLRLRSLSSKIENEFKRYK